MSNARLYRFWGDLTVALRTGEPQNEIKHTGKTMFEELYETLCDVGGATGQLSIILTNRHPQHEMHHL